MGKTYTLVTGGCGFIGYHLCKKLLSLGHSVVVVDNLSTGSKSNEIKDSEIKYIYGDTNSLDCVNALFSGYQFTYVYHLAAVVGVQLTLSNPLLVLEDLKGIDLIFKFSASSSVEKLFFASSSEVYGEPFVIPQNEITTPLNSRLPYAIVKNAGEAYGLAHREQSSLNSTSLRFFNAYGPRQRNDFVISLFIESAIANRPLNIYGDGSQTRTFCHVEDTANCMTNLLNPSINIESINIGSDIQITINELAQKIIKFTNSSSKIQYIPSLPKGDMTRRQPCCKLLNSVLPKDYKFIEFDQGLISTIDYHLSLK